MENRSHALFAGLFLLFLGAAAIAALWWFSGRQEESRRYVVETRNNVTGLNAQAQVRYRGIRVGRVESIRLDPADARTTLIEISLPRDIPITRGTVARLGHQGVTGIAHVLLEDEGKDARPLPTDGEDARIAMQDSLVQELADVGGDALRQARDLLAGMNEILRPENRQTISRTLANIDDLLRLENRQALSRTLVNMEAGSRHIRETGERLQRSLDQLLAPESIRRVDSVLLHAERTAAQAAPFFAEARGLVARLDAASEKFEAALGDANSGGVSALALRLNGLTGELAVTAQQLNRVLRLLEESPQSLIFGRRADAPGPGEAGFAPPGGSAP
ncbi:MAG: MlaD family protein [Candidatus Accumulibacter sp.]|jgi:phospholipid/cholesterol/gamma-HCH transport system substrate-binding protein|nr:MlaD family protein [Accumulibacter sp.]